MHKILIVITTGFVPYGGLTTVMMNYYRAMDKKGLKIDFASTNEAPEELLEELRRNGSEYFYLGDRKKKLPHYIWNLRRVLKKGCYNVIHVNGNSSTMAIELGTASACGVPMRIAHVHNMNSSSYRLLRKLLYIPFKKSCTHALSVSTLAGDWLYGSGKYTVLNNAIDAQKYQYSERIRRQYRQEFGLNDRFVIGNVGKLNTLKNHSFLLKVFQCVKMKRKDAALLLVGGGSLEDSLRKECKTLGIEKDVIFTGMVNNVSGYLQAMDAFVFPSLIEGFGLAVIEAQASGLPCLVSDTVPVETKVTDRIQYMSLDASVYGWMDAVLSMDITEREKKSEAARQSIALCGYDIKTEAEKLGELYRKSIMNGE